MGFVNGNVINAANVNQHVVTQTTPKPKAKKAAAKAEPKPEVAEVKVEAKESAPAES